MKNRIFVFTRLDAFLSAILDQARNGYIRYTTGQVSPCKIVALANKFELLYLTCADKNERFRQKLAGIAPARLLIYKRLRVRRYYGYCWFTRTAKTRRKNWKNCCRSTTAKPGWKLPGWNWYAATTQASCVGLGR